MAKKETKTTNEKPVSLSPLNFKDALAALLRIKQRPGNKKVGKKERGNL